MRYKTYKNMEKATKMIMQKGYDKNTANEIAMKCFDHVKENYKRNGMAIEWYIDKISVNQ